LETEKKKFRLCLIQFNIVAIKKYHPPPPGNLKCNKLGIFQSLKLRILAVKILPIPLKLNFAPNTSGCYGLKHFSL